MIYIPIFVNIVLLLLFDYRRLFFSLFYLSAKAVIPNALPIVRRCDMPAVFTHIDNLPY